MTNNGHADKLLHPILPVARDLRPEIACGDVLGWAPPRQRRSVEPDAT
jgi:hypothetical protein